MSTANVTPQDSGSMEQRVAALQAQLKAMDAALQATRTTRLILIAGFVGVIALVGTLFYSLGQRIQQKSFQDELTATAQKYLDGNKEHYIRHLQKFMDDATPRVTNAFYEQVKKDTPLYMQAVTQERIALAKNLERRLTDQIQGRYEATLKEYEQVFKAEFPQAADEKVQEKLVTNSKLAMEKLVKRYFVEQFNQELKEMYDVWDAFPIADAPGKDDAPLEDQLVGMLIDLVVLKAADNSDHTLVDAGAAGPAVAAPVSTPDSSNTTTPETKPTPGKSDSATNKPSEDQKDAKPAESDSAKSN